jgi:serine/threonine protein kinase
MDIKATNALYDSRTRVYRLSDTGLSCPAGSPQCGGDVSVPSADMERRTASGKRVVDIRKLRCKANSFAADMLAVGETAFVLVAGERPDDCNYAKYTDDKYLDEVPGYSREELMALTAEQRDYLLLEAYRDRCAAMVYDRLWEDELADKVYPICPQLANLLGWMLRPASERPTAEELLSHPAIKGEAHSGLARPCNSSCRLPFGTSSLLTRAASLAAVLLPACLHYAESFLSPICLRIVAHSFTAANLTHEDTPADGLYCPMLLLCASAEIVEQEKEHLLSVLPIWEARQKAAAQLATIVKHANASEALMQLQHSTGLAPLCPEGDGDIYGTTSSSGTSTPGSLSSNGSSRAGSFTSGSNAEMEGSEGSNAHGASDAQLVGGKSPIPDCPCSNESPLSPVASNSNIQETTAGPVVANSTQQEPLPARKGSTSSSGHTAGSSSEEGPATPSGSHSGSDDDTLLPSVPLSNNHHQQVPVAPGAISSSVGGTGPQQLPMPLTVNHLPTLWESEGAADCALGQDQAALQHTTTKGSHNVTDVPEHGVKLLERSPCDAQVGSSNPAPARFSSVRQKCRSR